MKIGIFKRPLLGYRWLKKSLKYIIYIYLMQREKRKQDANWVDKNMVEYSMQKMKIVDEKMEILTNFSQKKKE